MSNDQWQGGPWWRPADRCIDRRRALAGLSAIVLAALRSPDGSAQSPAQGAKTCVLTPQAGEGPFYLDPKLLRSDITSGQPGAALDLAFQVIRVGDCATLADARVDVWQADALGLYSGYEKQSGVGGVSVAAAAKQQFLRGTQMTDASGNVRFKTIFPSWYGGRTPHVHFKVFLGGNEVVASQIFFPDDITKQIFSEFQPYREHNSKRTTFNDNDPFKEGIHSEVTRQRDSFSAKVVLVVKPLNRMTLKNILSKRMAAACAVSLILLAGAMYPQSTVPRPVTDRELLEPDPADWLMWRRTLNSWGFSPLNQINQSNAGRLQLVWTRGMGPGIQEATPLVRDGVMFLPNPSDYIQALDAATGDLRWEYKRKLPEDLGKFLPVPSINRNLAIYGNQIIDTSADDFVFALDMMSGKLAWETLIVDYRQTPAQETSGPIIANGKIFSTRGCEFKFGPNGCIITAHDAKTGKELWRRRTIPKPGEPGDETWGGIPDNDRRHVGAWMVPSYDAEFNLLYVGTSVTSPAPKFLMAGNDKEYLYHNSTLAIDADTGRIVWYYQHVVDHWDFDHPFERLLVDTAVAPDASEVTWINPRLRPGERRKVITGIPGKTGIVYTLDRKTGEFLWARPTVRQNVVAKIDGATGKVTVNPETTFSAVGETRFICPSVSGGKDFQAGAYSPTTNAMYYGLQNICANQTSLDKGTMYAFNARAQIAPGTQNIGTLFAISAETGKTLWRYDQRAGLMSLVATGGGLLFVGDTIGSFRAFDQDSGKILWETNLGAPVTGYPITYLARGKQYVAVSVGNSLASSSINRLAEELRPGNASNVFVFALPQ